MTSNVRGLATLALLKTRFDEGRDHFELFEPFIADACAHATTESFAPADISELVKLRSGLSVPADTVRTLLNRLARRHLLKNVGGRFVVADDIGDPALSTATAEIEQRQHALARAFVDYAAEHELQVDEANGLSGLAQFITDNKVPLLLDEPLPDSPLDRSKLDRKTTRVVAGFITERCIGTPELAQPLQELIEGMVIQDTVLLRDLARLPDRFRDLRVVLDSPILLAALDLTGIANGIAAKEGLALLREAGAVTIAFHRTVAEIRRILAVYEERLATAGGRLALYPTDLTNYVLTAKLSPSDVRMISTSIERRLAAIAIPTWDVPKHDPRYTRDEESLAQALADIGSGVTDTPRIRHDVDCIAGVLTMRAGHRSDSLERSRAVFCTTSGRVIRNVQRWFRDQGERGAPPIVHQHALTSLAWLKRPATAHGVKLHELAALCAAALRPAPETWDRFVGNLRNLREDGSLTDDETVAIVASGLTEPLLAGLDEDNEPDSDTIQEAIERVRRTYRDEAEVAARAAVTEARSEAAIAQAAASDALRQVIDVRRLSAGRAKRTGNAIAAFAFYLAVAIVVAAGLLSIPGLLDSVPNSIGWLSRGVLVVGIGIGVYSQIHGPGLAEVRIRLAGWIANLVHEILYGQPLPADVADEDVAV